MPKKAQLLAEIQKTWDALNAGLERLTEEQMTAKHDAQGWTVKDHLVHLARWERSVVYLLLGKPRHAGLGIDEALYLRHSYDEINAAIFHQAQHGTLPEAIADLRKVHRQMLGILQRMSDSDLQLPYRHYLPDEPGEGDGPPVFDLIDGNTASHFADHLSWIETLAEA